MDKCTHIYKVYERKKKYKIWNYFDKLKRNGLSKIGKKRTRNKKKSFIYTCMFVYEDSFSLCSLYFCVYIAGGE